LGIAAFSGNSLATLDLTNSAALIAIYNLSGKCSRHLSRSCGVDRLRGEGFGRQKGYTEMYRGAEYLVDFLPKSKIEILVHDDEVEPAIDVIISKASTGKIGDGKIFITNLDEVIRIRTKERGDSAL
jgi:nitrogen regulatory protein PII